MLILVHINSYPFFVQASLRSYSYLCTHSYPFEHIAMMQPLRPIPKVHIPSCSFCLKLPYLMKLEQNQNSPKQVAFNTDQNYVRSSIPVSF